MDDEKIAAAADNARLLERLVEAKRLYTLANIRAEILVLGAIERAIERPAPATLSALAAVLTALRLPMHGMR